MLSFQFQPLESRTCLSLSFATPVNSQVGPVAEMAVGDFDRDGFADLAVWNGAGAFAAIPMLRILAGDGHGKFHEVGRAFAGSDVADLEAADLNRDGSLDLVAANGGAGTATVLLGKGDGTFSAGRSYFVGADTRDVVVADFDGNGVPDIAAANAEMWSPYPNSEMPSRFGAGLLRGLGDGSFGRVMMIPLSDAQTHIVAGDVDGNGRVDAVLGGPFSMSLSPVPRALIHVVLNYTGPTATGTVRGGMVVRQFSPFAGDVAGLALRDLNADRRADLAAVQDFAGSSSGNADAGTATLHTMISNGDGTFSAKAAVNARVDRPAGLSVGDLDRDGLVDFVIAGVPAGPIIAIYPPPGVASVMLGTGGGGMAAPRLINAGTAGSAQGLADLDRDGRLDIVTGAPNGVWAMLNTTAPNARAAVARAG
jgi:hypothetical protein